MEHTYKFNMGDQVAPLRVPDNHRGEKGRIVGLYTGSDNVSRYQVKLASGYTLPSVLERDLVYIGDDPYEFTDRELALISMMAESVLRNPFTAHDMHEEVAALSDKVNRMLNDE